MLLYLLVGVGCLLVGYLLGAKRARRVKRRVLQELNAQSLELLDTKSSLSAMRQATARQPRKDKLLNLTLRKLQQSNAHSRNLCDMLTKQNRKHYIELSRLRLRAIEARETAFKAATIARQATAHLRRLEQASPVTQTIEAPEPKSYGIGEPVTVSVVDQARLNSPSDAASAVSNRDSDRLSKLHSSNESTTPALS